MSCLANPEKSRMPGRAGTTTWLTSMRQFFGALVFILMSQVFPAVAAEAIAAPPDSAPVTLAQSGSVPNPLPERRGSSAPELPSIEPTQQSGPANPPVQGTPSPSQPLLSNNPIFVLKAVTVTGNTVIEQAAIDKAIAPFLNRPVGLRDLEELRQQVTLLYVKRGYINSGAVIPDQNISDGVLTLRVVEGTVTGIELTGNRYYRTSYLTDRLALGITRPFNVNDLGQRQQILLTEPFLSRLNLNILPGLVPGEARVTGDVTEILPYTVSFQIANDQSPTVGEIRGQVQAVAGNLLGFGDIFAVQYGRSGGLNDGAVSYSFPIAADDTRITLRYDVNDTLVISQQLQALNITSQYQSIAVGVSRPFYRTPEQNLTLGLSMEWRESRTFLLSEPFAFVPGSDNGNTNVTAVRFYQSWLDQNAERVLALRSTFSLGIDALGATVTGTKPSGQFFDWLGQAQFVHRIFRDWEFVARGSLQLSADPLFPIEQFVLGGMSTVRGYREYLSATDNAFAGTLELRVPVGRLPLPRVSTNDADGTVQLAPFFDRGIGWNTGRATPPDSNLASVGIGLRWLVGSGVTAEIYYGHGLRRIDVGNSLEDQGVHFRITADVL
jgi:hemolysin activation/secretion protein